VLYIWRINDVYKYRNIFVLSFLTSGLTVITRAYGRDDYMPLSGIISTEFDSKNWLFSWSHNPSRVGGDFPILEPMFYQNTRRHIPETYNFQMQTRFVHQQEQGKHTKRMVVTSGPGTKFPSTAAVRHEDGFSQLQVQVQQMRGVSNFLSDFRLCSSRLWDCVVL
jgi:hypothetical protein